VLHPLSSNHHLKDCSIWKELPIAKKGKRRNNSEEQDEDEDEKDKGAFMIFTTVRMQEEKCINRLLNATL
jgi:hypothetical protein